MRKLSILFGFFLSLVFSNYAFALLNLELTHGVAGAVPIAIAPFVVDGSTPMQDVSGIVSNDLRNSGRFKVFGADTITQIPTSVSDIKYSYFKSLGADNLVIGKVVSLGGNRYRVSFTLADVIRGGDSDAAGQPVMLSKSFEVSGEQLRPLAHHISDMIYQQILGVRGIFSTKIAYVVVKRTPGQEPQHILEVSDQDGYNPRPLLISPDPIMSPAWSPNGRKIAYVSFENRRASIYVEDVATGARQLVSQYPGINGAPAWSPDGRKLAVVLSKDGSPNIYVIDLGSRHLTQMTKDWSINTEPSWSKDGSSIIFTSNRGGGPQIYQLNVASRAVSRVTYDGDYNARASYADDNSNIVVLHRESGVYKIGMLDLNSSNFKILTNTNSDNESPSVAPNSSMVLYGTLYNGRSVLGMVSSDGRVQIRLPARNGDVQDPAWSPFLT